MPFATVQDLIDQYSKERLVNVAGIAPGFDPADALDAGTIKLQAEIDRYGAEIDAAVRAHYGDTHTYDRTSTLLRSFNVEGAWLYLIQNSKQGLDEKGHEQLKRLDKSVQRLGSGAMKLPALPDDAPDVAVTSQQSFRGRGRMFARPYAEDRYAE